MTGALAPLKRDWRRTVFSDGRLGGRGGDGEAALVEIAAKPGVDAAGGGQVRGLYRIVGGAAVLWGRQAVEGEGVVAASVQSRVERLLRNTVR